MPGLSWLLGGTAILLVVTNLATGWKAYEFGGNAQKVICERRVNILQAQWEEEVAKVKATNDAWTKALIVVQEAGNKEAAEDQAAIEALNKKVEAYEETLDKNAACIINKSDVDKLR